MITLQKPHHIDYPFAIVTATVVLLGILLLAEISAVFSQEKFGEISYYFSHQMLFGLFLGALLGFIAFKIPLHYFKKFAWQMILLNLALILFVFIPSMGIVSGGAPRWLNLKFVSLQPSEFLKITFIIYASTWLARRIEKKALNKKTIIPFFAILGVITLMLILQNDASTLGVIVFSAISMYFLANAPFWHTLLMLGVSGIGLLLLVGVTPFRMNRILVFLGVQDDPMGSGFQIKQALIAIGSGGILGLGVGMSRQINFLPQTMSDSIFAIYAEETGFIGSCFLISLFMFFLWRVFEIAKNSSDKFSQIFAVGFGSWIFLQAFVNIGSMLHILPLTGIPLPFIGYGGSHLIAEFIGIGILLNISKYTQK
jgi:cell division protein FtsW